MVAVQNGKVLVSGDGEVCLTCCGGPVTCADLTDCATCPDLMTGILLDLDLEVLANGNILRFTIVGPSFRGFPLPIGCNWSTCEDAPECGNLISWSVLAHPDTPEETDISDQWDGGAVDVFCGTLIQDPFPDVWFLRFRLTSSVFPGEVIGFDFYTPLNECPTNGPGWTFVQVFPIGNYVILDPGQVILS